MIKDKILIIIGVLLILVAVFVVVSGLTLSSGEFEYPFELPLSIVDSIAVDGNQNIYCGSIFYSRIQVYNKNGKYLRGWHVNANQGAFIVRSNENSIQVDSFRNQKRFYYNTNGKVLKTEEFQDLNIGYDPSVPQTSDRYGNEYSLNGRLISPKVEKIESRASITVVHTPWYLNLILFPFPCVVWGLAGLLTCAYIVFWKKS